MSMFSVCLDCSKLLLSLFPRDANKSTNGEGVFPVVATETASLYWSTGLESWCCKARSLLAIVNLRYWIFHINLGDQSSSAVGFLTLFHSRVFNHSLNFPEQ